MAYAPHALVAICGDWGIQSDAAREVWQFGIRISTGTPAGGYLNDPQAYANGVGPNIDTWFRAVGNGMSTLARLLTVKVNNIKPDGSYKDNTTHQYVLPVAHTGGTSGIYPGFTSLAWTFYTDLGRAPGGRGRCYPPNGTYALNGGAFSCNSATATTNVTAAKALLSILLARLDGTTAIMPVVASRQTGALGAIQQVSSDTIFDVQRRRKNRASGVRVTQNWP